MNSHANVLATALDFGDRAGLTDGDVVFAVAPLFHITGAMLNAAVALMRDCLLVFANRFDAAVTLDAFVEHRVTYTIGSITVFNAISALPEASAEHFESVKTLYSGGAPIPPATVKAFAARFGHYIHNAYGMTETTAGVIAVPRAPRLRWTRRAGHCRSGSPYPGCSCAPSIRLGIRHLPGSPVSSKSLGRRLFPATGETPTHPCRRCPMAGSAPVTSHSSTSRAGCTSWIG